MLKEALSKTALILTICICLVPETRGQEDPCEEPAESWYETKQEAADACFSAWFTCLVDTTNRHYRCKHIFHANKRRFIWCPEGQVIKKGGVGCEVRPKHNFVAQIIDVDGIPQAGATLTADLRITRNDEIAEPKFSDPNRLWLSLHPFDVSTIIMELLVPPVELVNRDDEKIFEDFAVALPADLQPGEYCLAWIVNTGVYFHYLLTGSATESEEKLALDNIWTYCFTIEEEIPDLQLNLAEHTSETVPNGEIGAEVQLSNVGTGNVDDPIELSVTVEGNESVIGTWTHSAGLPGGDVVDLLLLGSMPEDVMGDSYTVTIQAGAVDGEQNTANNAVSFVVAAATTDTKEGQDIDCGNPVTTNTGIKTETEVDYQGTGPFPLELARFYRSSRSNPGGWRFSYSRQLLIVERQATTDVILVADNGTRLEFVDIDQRGFSDPDVPGFITRNGTGFDYLDAMGTRHQFDAQGKLVSLISRTGFTQQLTYDNGLLDTVSDQFGRLIQFEHNADGQISAATLPDGRRYNYEYDDNGLLVKVIIPDGTPAQTDNPVREYLYGSPHLRHGLTGVIDENVQRFSTFDYDEDGRTTLSVHENGVDQYSFSYAEGVTSVTNPLVKTSEFIFEEMHGSNHLVRVDGHATANCPAMTSTRTYDERGFVREAIDRNGNVTRFTYTHTDLPVDTYLYQVGLVTSRTEAADTADARTTHIEWHPIHRLPVTIEVPGRRMELTYDTNAQLIERREHDTATGSARIWRNTYDASGLLIEIDGPRTDVADLTSFAYNNKGEFTGITNALGHTTRITAHDANGLPTTVVDPNGLTMHLSYDERMRLVTQRIVSEAGESNTFIGYDDKGNVTSIRLPDGQTLIYTYDPADRLTAIDNDLGERIEFTLDAAGNRTAAITRDAGGSIIRRQRQVFDELGRLISTLGAVNQSTDFEYDNNNNLARVEDALDRQTSFAFDGLDRLISVTDALAGESTFTYDARDNLTRVVDAEGVATTYEYDGLNNLVREVSTASGATTYVYDPAGNRIASTDSNGVTMRYRYDALNRSTRIDYSGAPQETITYTYDEREHGVGRLTGINDESGETRFSYDDRGNLVTDHRVIHGVNYTTRYIYNLANQLTRVIYPSGRIVNYELDNLSRVTGISTRANGVAPAAVVASDFDYLPFGPASGWQHGNGLNTSIGYDKDYRVTDIDVADRDAIMALNYTYNDVANVTALLDTLGENSQTFAYDELNRLSAASGVYGEVDYTYDGVGNRQTRTIRKDSDTTQESYTYEAGSHQLIEVVADSPAGTDTRRIQHDANGNTVSDADGNQALELISDARNRLSAVYKDGKQAGEYHYNALGQRVAKTYTYRGRIHSHVDLGNKGKGSKSKGNKGKGKNADKDNAASTNLHVTRDNKPVNETLHFQYDQSGNLIAESDKYGRVIREYIYLGNYRIAMVGPAVNATSNGVNLGNSEGSLYYLHNDHLGTTRKVTDSDQRIVWDATQTPFGELVLNTEAIRMPMRLPGQYADLETGYSHNYFRDYDPSLGRYIQTDPIGLEGGLNTYAYVENDPLINIDPYGLATYSIGAGGSFQATAAGASASASVGVDSDGQACIQVTACGRIGPGESASVTLQIGAGDGTFCEGNSVSGGVFAEGGAGLFGGGSVEYGEGGASVSSGINVGIGGGAAAGSQACLTRTICF